MRVGGISINVQRWTPDGGYESHTVSPASEPVHLLRPDQALHVMAASLTLSEVPMPDADALRTLQELRGLG